MYLALIAHDDTVCAHCGCDIIHVDNNQSASDYCSAACERAAELRQPIRRRTDALTATEHRQ